MCHIQHKTRQILKKEQKIKELLTICFVHNNGYCTMNIHIIVMFNEVLNAVEKEYDFIIDLICRM